ncbi:hypothetical protein EMPG_13276 [Blastomyces silverae]|uniref:Uncharacterized protein n=1 Tax=Blastomyces silverae TaxID=2060906 RepID=A0A0H1BJL2_9EURO|nr:hypothetical protein EMPG_13276 [Blastomyces silverae]
MFLERKVDKRRLEKLITGFHRLCRSLFRRLDRRHDCRPGLVSCGSRDRTDQRTASSMIPASYPLWVESSMICTCLESLVVFPAPIAALVSHASHILVKIAHMLS